MKKLLLLSVLCLTIVALAACGSNNNNANGNDGDNGNNAKTENNTGASDSSSVLDQIKDKGTVTVGFANEKPYAYKEDGELKGAAVDIATAVFKKLGVDNVKGQLAEFSQLIPGLNAHKFDVITAGMAIKPERCENVAFGEPEMMYGEGMVVKKGNPKGLHSYKDIADKGAKVSIMAGATENDYVKHEGVKEKQIQSANDIPSTFSAVSSGRADATAGTAMTLRNALKSADTSKLEFVSDFEQPDIEGVPSYGAAAFNKDSNELRKAYNEKLAELKEDGTLKELLEKNGFNAHDNFPPSDITTEGVCSGDQY